MLDEDTLKEVKKAKDLMAIVESLHNRIEGHLAKVISSAIRKNDKEYIIALIDELPDGFHKSEMKKYLNKLESGGRRDDDYYEG